MVEILHILYWDIVNDVSSEQATSKVVQNLFEDVYFEFPLARKGHERGIPRTGRPHGRPTLAACPRPPEGKPAHFLCGIFHRLINARSLITHTRFSHTRRVRVNLSRVHTSGAAYSSQHLSRYDNLTLNNELWIITQGERHATDSSGSSRRFDVLEDSPSNHWSWVILAKSRSPYDLPRWPRWVAHFNVNLSKRTILYICHYIVLLFVRQSFIRYLK